MTDKLLTDFGPLPYPDLRAGERVGGYEQRPEIEAAGSEQDAHSQPTARPLDSKPDSGCAPGKQSPIRPPLNIGDGRRSVVARSQFMSQADASARFHLSNDPALILLNQEQLAELLGCSTRTLERQRLEGTSIPFVRVGRLVRYRLIDVHQYLERQRRTSTSDTRPEDSRQ